MASGPDRRDVQILFLFLIKAARRVVILDLIPRPLRLLFPLFLPMLFEHLLYTLLVLGISITRWELLYGSEPLHVALLRIKRNVCTLLINKSLSSAGFCSLVSLAQRSSV